MNSPPIVRRSLQPPVPAAGDQHHARLSRLVHTNSSGAHIPPRHPSSVDPVVPGTASMSQSSQSSLSSFQSTSLSSLTTMRRSGTQTPASDDSADEGTRQRLNLAHQKELSIRTKPSPHRIVPPSPLRSQQRNAPHATVGSSSATNPADVVQVTQKHLADIFDPHRDSDASVPYHADGDDAFYSEEAVEKRKSLEDNPRIRAKILLLISLYKRTPSSRIPKSEYVRIHSAIIKILRPQITASQLSACVLDDWEKDMQQKFEIKTLQQQAAEWLSEFERANLTARTAAATVASRAAAASFGNEMPEDVLFHSIFQLVDMWTLSTNAEEYIAFLETLYDRLTKPDTGNPQAAYDILSDHHDGPVKATRKKTPTSKHKKPVPSKKKSSK